MNPKSHSNGHYLKGIRIEDLFGRYSYNLRSQERSESSPSRLLILYGNNGAGKTTILKLVFHLLSYKDGRGHRSFIAITPFRRIEIDLGLDVTIVASRRGKEIIGNFYLSILKKGETITKALFEINDDGTLSGVSESQRTFLQALKSMNSHVFFLSDERSIYSDMLPSEGSRDRDLESFEPIPRVQHIVGRDERSLRARSRRRLLEAARMRDDILEQSIRRAKEWAMQQVLQGSTRGDADANAIYRDVIKRIARITGRRPRKGPGPKRLKEELLSDVREQSRRAEEFVRHGLMAPLDDKAVVQAINNALDSALPTLKDVVTPYLNGLKAKLNAMQEVLVSISTFTEIVNSFYHDKSVQFDIKEGLHIVVHGGDELSASALSSGERQLLLLFTNVISAKRNSIFIIDEPELSLNAEWQRQLVRRLLELTKNSGIQFLLATHSIPLLTRHKAYVSPLTGE